jgi:hypothetical protein
MNDKVLLRSPLSSEACWKRIAGAQENGSCTVVGYALGSLMQVAAYGDQFELRHTVEPAVFMGSVVSDGSGSSITGIITVPGRNFYASVLVFALTVGLLVMGRSAWDLLFGTHRLLTRKATELGPGHPANLEQHLAVFVLVPLVLVAVILVFGPKARGVSIERRQTTLEFLHTFFQTPMT